MLVLVMARVFYGAALLRTGGEWSAPLDDVFIHFDYARSAARGFPFQWSEGNGYSSGQTSLTYPFVLALGYWIGFRGPGIMLWAAIVACCSLFACLLVVPRLARGLPEAASFILPVSLFSVGALVWSLFSGMEAAWFMAIWAIALSFSLRHKNSPSVQWPQLGWKLGIAGAFLVSTRPEASTSIAILGITAAAFVWKSSKHARPPILTLLRAGSPSIAAIGVHSVVNKSLTGDYAAAGAVTKLAWYHPHMLAEEKWSKYVDDLQYVFVRNIDHHFTAFPWYGWIPIVLAAIALISPRTRVSAAILLSSALSFLLLVAMNGQVRWQNERYTMPSVAWLLLAAGLGVGVLLFRPRTILPWTTAVPRWIIAAALVIAFGYAQAPRMQEQLTHFAQASKNIRDQQVTVGRILRQRTNPTPRRILVGDAGAITYAADLPGLDIIGLGGYKGLPFARASRFGTAAIIELIERIPPNDRPDILAIYPSWWQEIPIWFGRRLASVTAEENVVCGAPEKVIYAANWKMLNTGDYPSTLQPGEIIVDSLDIADIVSEELHNYRYPNRKAGYVELRILADPLDSTRDVLDGGRKIPDGGVEQFELATIRGANKMRIIARTAPTAPGQVEVAVDGKPIGSMKLEPSNHWVELSIPIPSEQLGGDRLNITFTARSKPRWANYHVWLIATP